MLSNKNTKNANFLFIVDMLKDLLTQELITEKEYARAKKYYMKLIHILAPINYQKLFKPFARKLLNLADKFYSIQESWIFWSNKIPLKV